MPNEIIYYNGKKYKKVGPNEKIKEGAIHSITKGRFWPIHWDETVGQTPSDFAEDRSFYNLVEKDNIYEVISIKSGLFIQQENNGLITVINNEEGSTYHGLTIDQASDVIGACIMAGLVSARKIDIAMNPEERCPNCGNHNRLCTC